jgi:hypothetical protein
MNTTRTRLSRMFLTASFADQYTLRMTTMNATTTNVSKPAVRELKALRTTERAAKAAAMHRCCRCCRCCRCFFK